MKLTTKVQYSIKALLDLSLQSNYGPISVNEIAKRQQLPAPYLEKLLIQMRRAGLVSSLRGVQGGYQLAIQPRDISLAQILQAVGEEIEPLASVNSNLTRAEDWVTLCLWKRLNSKLKEVLYSITLADLYYDARSWQASQGQQTSFIV